MIGNAPTSFLFPKQAPILTGSIPIVSPGILPTELYLVYCGQGETRTLTLLAHAPKACVSTIPPLAQNLLQFVLLETKLIF